MEVINIHIFAYSDKGCILAKQICNLFDNAECFAIDKFAKLHNITSVKNTKEKVGEIFASSNLIIFISACGIAVRSIASCIQDKTTDPAVIVIDECANFAIPILSGHIGGANKKAKYIAQKIGAAAVITTATDINDRFSVDEWATKNKYTISNMEAAKKISSAILIHDIALKSDFKIITTLAKGLIMKDMADIGIYLTYTKANPFKTTLRLVPKCLVVGIGCKKGTKSEDIIDALHETLQKHNIDINAVEKITSIDLKNQEQGLLETAKKYNMPIEFYSAEQLNQLEGEFSQSNFVKSITGVDNVCERSACYGAAGNHIIVKKTIKNSVTIAIALKEIEVSNNND